MDTVKRFKVVEIDYNIEEDKTIKAWYVHDTRLDLFVGLDDCPAANPCLCISEARKIAFWLNKWM